MVVLIKAVGVLILTAGIVFFIYPQAAKKLFSFFRQGRRIYIAGVLRILFGVIFLMGASDCRTVGVITTSLISKRSITRRREEEQKAEQ